MKKQTAKLAARVERLRKMLAREPLNTAQIAARLGVGSGHVLEIARHAGLEHLVVKRKAGQISGSDF